MRRSRWFSVCPLLLAALLLAAVIACAITSGCGMETDEANEALAAANKHQAEAEEVLARLNNFPAEWEALLNVPNVGPDQVNAARQLVQAREQDLEQLEQALKAWGEGLNKIPALNVDERIKEYVSLKMNSIKCWTDYAESYLMPLIKAYSGIVEEVAYGRPQAEINQKAAEIAELVNQTVTKIEECEGAEKQADEYFKKNKLGE